MVSLFRAVYFFSYAFFFFGKQACQDESSTFRQEQNDSIWCRSESGTNATTSAAPLTDQPYIARTTITMRHPSICKNCGFTISGNYCEQCGQKTAVSPITLHGIVHEIFHYFTHLDKGFGYTLKKLIMVPGTMQRNYLEGERTRHQKPFSMFFICGTISGLGYYLVNVATAKLYGEQDLVSQDFYRHYFVLLQALLLPLYALITRICFRNQIYNFAETLVMMLYTLSLVFLVLVPIVAINLLFPGYENRILEVIFLLFYITKTNLNFYSGKKWRIILQTVISIGLCYAVSQLFNKVSMDILQ